MSSKIFRSSLAPFALLLMLAGCEKQGPLERAGEEIDEAVEDVRAGGETTANKVDDAVDEVVDAADDVRKDLE
jgi:predicted small lipoprotein YifL